MENKTYTFTDLEELKEFINTEIKLARKGLRETKNKAYKEYVYMLINITEKYSKYYGYHVEDIKFSSLKDFALDLKANDMGRMATIGWVFAGKSESTRDIEEKHYRQYFYDQNKAYLDEIFKDGQTMLQE